MALARLSHRPTTLPPDLTSTHWTVCGYLRWNVFFYPLRARVAHLSTRCRCTSTAAPCGVEDELGEPCQCARTPCSLGVCGCCSARGIKTDSTVREPKVGDRLVLLVYSHHKFISHFLSNQRLSRRLSVGIHTGFLRPLCCQPRYPFPT